MDKLGIIFKTKIINFIIQISILSLLIYLFDYRYNINFDIDISDERRIIIQFIANYIFFNLNDLSSLFFIFISWMVVSLIPIFNFDDYKKSYSMNLTTFFFPNFFFYVFLYRHSPNYFNSHFQILFTQTVFLGLFIAFFSLGLTFILKKIKIPSDITKFEDLKLIVLENKIKCPSCGIEYNSIPKYCYNCSKELILDGVGNDE
ncbi:MAG: hypothetical protein ACFFDO_01305 [Candidatus Thorarchaeota archaeon]